MKIISVIRSSLSNQSSPTFCLWHSWVTHAKCPRCPCPLFYACTLCNSMVGWVQNISIMCYWLVQPTWLAPISQARFGWVQKSSVSRVCDGILSNTAVNNLRMVNPFNWSLWYLGQRKEILILRWFKFLREWMRCPEKCKELWWNSKCWKLGRGWWQRIIPERKWWVCSFPSDVWVFVDLWYIGKQKSNGYRWSRERRRGAG